MKRIVAILLILCLCPLCAWTETAEAPDKQSFSELMCAIVAANQPEILWGRYESLTFQFSNPAAPDGYDVVWQTKDAYYQSYADLFAVWEKDQVYCRMDWEQEAGEKRIFADRDMFKIRTKRNGETDTMVLSKSLNKREPGIRGRNRPGPSDRGRGNL